MTPRQFYTSEQSFVNPAAYRDAAGMKPDAYDRPDSHAVKGHLKSPSSFALTIASIEFVTSSF
jgi:hypothetical protein